jgi:hypothetical protein
MLKGFEMTSGLKVKFHKSCLLGINVSSEFMSMTCKFLNCSEGVVSLKHLGLSVGANRLKPVTWEPLFEQFVSET